MRRLEEQYDLSHLPEILVAAKRHHRLVRQHGLVEARRAYQDALEVNLGWAQRGWWGRHRDQRLRQLPGGPARLIGDPALHAAVYPETVRLACVMVSPHWISCSRFGRCKRPGTLLCRGGSPPRPVRVPPRASETPSPAGFPDEARLGIAAVRMTVSTGPIVTS